jgi:hypothetical protein
MMAYYASHSLITTLNIDLDDDKWSQALLPVRWGGHGIHIVVSLSLSALHGFSREHCKIHVVSPPDSTARRR